MVEMTLSPVLKVWSLKIEGFYPSKNEKLRLQYMLRFFAPRVPMPTDSIQKSWEAMAAQSQVNNSRDTKNGLIYFLQDDGDKLGKAVWGDGFHDKAWYAFASLAVTIYGRIICLGEDQGGFQMMPFEVGNGEGEWAGFKYPGKGYETFAIEQVQEGCGDSFEASKDVRINSYLAVTVLATTTCNTSLPFHRQAKSEAEGYSTSISIPSSQSYRLERFLLLQERLLSRAARVSAASSPVSRPRTAGKGPRW